MDLRGNPSNKKGYNMMIIDAFIERKAIESNNSINYEDIVLPISDSEKRILLNSLIKDGFIRVEEDESMWFDSEKWKRTANMISNVYFVILMIPIIVVAILMLVLNRLT